MNIFHTRINPFEETIENAEEYDLDQGARIVHPTFITEKMDRSRHRFYTASDRAEEQGIGHYFIPRYTRVIDTVESRNDINQAYNQISTSKVRNEMIANDTKQSISQKQTPVILTRYKEHAKILYDMLKNEADHVFLLYGDNSDKENVEMRIRLKQVPRTESLILIATGQKIGEGFDFPRMDGIDACRAGVRGRTFGTVY